MKRLLYNNVRIIAISLLALISLCSECHAEEIVFESPAWFQKQYKELAGNVDALDKLTNNALNKYPNNSIAHELRGRYYLYIGNRIDGKERGEGVAPTSENKANYEKARFHLIKALKYDSENITARQQMLSLETAVGEYSSALIYCNELLEVAPYDAGLWKKKIDLYRRIGNEIEADRLTHRYMSIYTNDTIFKLGEAERKEAKLKKQQEDRYGYVASEKENTLREMIALHPNRPAYYYYLLNHLSANGRPEEAIEVAGKAAHMCKGASRDSIVNMIIDKDTIYEAFVDRNWFIEKRVKILCDLNRTNEAENYLLNLKKEGYYNERLLTDVRLETAKATKMNDPYEANAFIYNKTKSQEALNYLINTAIQRGYYDDALLYIKKVPRHDWRLKLKEYTVYKRMGNTSKAYSMLPGIIESMPETADRYDPTCDLIKFRLNEAKDMMAVGDYRSAITPLNDLLRTSIKGFKLTPGDDIHGYYEMAWSYLHTCYVNTKQYGKAEVALDSLYGKYRMNDRIGYELRRADLYNACDRQQEAVNNLYSSWKNANDNEEATALAGAYEEIAIPYIKSLIVTKKTRQAEDNVKKAIEVCPKNIELLTYGINTALTLNDIQLLNDRIEQGLRVEPDNREFIIKKAQYQQAQHKYEDAIATVTPLFGTYYGDSVIIGVYADNCLQLTDSLLKSRRDGYIQRTDEICTTAEMIIPDNKVITKIRGRYYEALSKKDFSHALIYRAKADSCYRLCRSEFDTPAEYRSTTNQLAYDSRHNQLSFEYMHGISGEEAIHTGTAYMGYKYISDRGDEFDLNLAYAGRSGARGDSLLTDYTRGGIGFQVGAGWKHNFSPTLTTDVFAAYATHYFPMLTAKLGVTIHLRGDWDLNVHTAYRNMETYTGVYKKNPQTQLVEIDHWESSHTSLLQLGASASKSLGTQFILTAGGDCFLLDKSFFANGNVKLQYFPLEGSKNSFFVSGGLGTAPDGMMLDRAHTVSFKNLNGFASMGGFVLLTRNLSVGLSGTWSTIYVKTERPTTESQTKLEIKNSYKNYFYINANVVIKF